MFNAIADYYRLFRAGTMLARHDVLIPAEIRARLPWPGKLVGIFMRALPRIQSKGSTGVRFAAALEKMGPAYVKLGQFLATRPDIIGMQSAQDLSRLKDKVPPFGLEKARQTLKEEFPETWETLFPQLEKPVAAASIAQVHRIQTSDGVKALKILRPGVEKHIEKELRALKRLARIVEARLPDTRRMRPVDSINTLARSLTQELDLRFEAGAASEFREVIKEDAYVSSPDVDWNRVSRRVLCTDWVDGIPMTSAGALEGVDRVDIANKITRSFLATALDHGFFHADLHEGNMILTPPTKEGGKHGLTLIDFGIMGRIGHNERLFLAEILNGFLTRNYKRIAQVHFDGGYVPEEHSVDDFAQALRSVGEPIFGHNADNVEMGRLIMQLFDITHQFGMRLRPELVLLQKTMVQVEGVARQIDPEHNIWEAARPVVERWVKREFGPAGAAKIAQSVAKDATNRLKRLPEIMDRFENALIQLETPPKYIKPKSNWGLWVLILLLSAALAGFAGFTTALHI